jgi:hypothetical protein
MGGRCYRAMKVEMRGTKFGCLSTEQNLVRIPPNLESLKGEIASREQMESIEELISY